MAGMEQLEIQKKSYLVRWVDVKENHTISWSIQSHKKSINFGIFKHPASTWNSTPKLGSSTFEVPPTPAFKPSNASSEAVNTQGAPNAAIEKLTGIGLKLVSWHGTCEANIVTTGHYDVPKNEGGMYALVFDNTFSKQHSKMVTFVLLTYQTSAAPNSSQQVGYFIHSNAAGSNPSLRTSKSRSKLRVEDPAADSSSETNQLGSGQQKERAASKSRDQNSAQSSTKYFTGVMQKRRRKRHQGYARRFFSLDFYTSTLSYYHDRNALNIRGAIPLSLAAVGANATTREISIDSGAEIWHLKAYTVKDFEAWKIALETAAKPQGQDPDSLDLDSSGPRRIQSSFRPDSETERELAKLEAILSRISVSRDLARSLAKDTDPKHLSLAIPRVEHGGAASASSSDVSPIDAAAADDYFQSQDRRHFWRRKVSGGRSSPLSRRSPGPPTGSSPGEGTQQIRSRVPSDGAFHEHCMDLLRGLDSIVAEFASVIAENKNRRPILHHVAGSRLSIESVASQEFFDAETGDSSQLLTIEQGSDDEANLTELESNADEHGDSASSASDLDDLEDVKESTNLGKGPESFFPSKAKGLNIQAYAPVQRRSGVPPATTTPPSLIGILRKNVGKDMSAISMPVTSNEPISLLQKSAEQMEYSYLLDQAAEESLSSVERLLYVTAFALSMLSEFRLKERRKPFNPLLGETYELIREDKGYRFVAEKVSHRPIRLACQADSEKWALSQSPAPTQKFWGKSVELITDGKVRIAFHDLGQHFVYTTATCTVRNLIAGEKYIEPVGQMTVTNSVTGEHAVAQFQVKGMFSGRSEEVVVRAMDRSGREQPLRLTGKWTESLTIVENGHQRSSPIWAVGNLAPDAAKCYGFPAFTASLNEINDRDRDRMAPTDSRLRPDQRAAEEADTESAEEMKVKLEEAQRGRRAQLDAGGEDWKPVWFTKMDGLEGEEIWKLKPGKDGYWEARARGDWKNAPQIFAV